MRNLTDHRIDGADGLGVERVRCTCSPKWVTPTEFTEHIAEIAADTREERVRAMEVRAAKDSQDAHWAYMRATMLNVQTTLAAEDAKRSATLADNAANYSRDKAGMNRTPGTDTPPKRRWWQI